MEISEALELLEPLNDEHWTTDGLPRVDIVADLIGDDKLKRADIMKAAPDFVRPVSDSKETIVEDVDTDQTGVEAVEALSYEDQLAVEYSTLNAEQATLHKQINALTQELKGVTAKAHRVAGLMQRMRKQSPNKDIQDFLATQAKVREEKAERVKALEGTNINELLRSVGPSKIDQALKVRKPAQRPSMPSRAVRVGD